jgi:hypothetical protein
MRTFDQLTASEQQRAIDWVISDIMEFLVEEDEVPDCLDDFKEIIFGAMEEAERCKTPWFFLDILQKEMDNHPEMKAALLAEAADVAKRAWYPADGEFIIHLPEAKAEDKDLNLN